MATSASRQRRLKRVAGDNQSSLTRRGELDHRCSRALKNTATFKMPLRGQALFHLLIYAHSATPPITTFEKCKFYQVSQIKYSLSDK
jgi:hypothetical protein